MAEHSLLLIDDDPNVVDAVGRFFEARAYDVHRASSGEEGIALWEREEPEVTVVDLRMPGMDGLTVLERLRAKGATVIMLTGYGEIDIAVSAMQRGAENFLTKPIDMSHLGAAVAKAAEKAALRSENRVLQARLRPSGKRRLLQIILILVLIGGSLGIGLAIGAGGDAEDVRARRPIPVPIDTTP